MLMIERDLNYFISKEQITPLIGNGTIKTHVLQAAFACCLVVRNYQNSEREWPLPRNSRY